MHVLFQLMRFVGVGVAGLFLLLAGTFLLTEYAGLWYFWAFLITAVCNWTFLFFAHSFFTFSGHKKEHYAKKYMTFIGMYAVGFVINVVLVYALTTLMGMPYLISISLAAAVTTGISFAMTKMHIFTYGN